MTLQQYLDRIRAAGDPEHLWQAMRDFYLGTGARMVSYRHFEANGEEGDTPHIVQEGFPPDYVERFVRDRLYLNNPIAELALQMSEPFYWSNSQKIHMLPPEDRAHIADLTQGIPGEVLIIQTFGPGGRKGTINLGFDPGIPRHSPAQIHEWQMAGQIAHLTYCGMVEPLQDEAPPGLSAREIEVLDWISKGKSNSVIAEILGISAHTVDTHVRRIFRKLDVNDRTTAAVKGVGAGLLQAA